MPPCFFLSHWLTVTASRPGNANGSITRQRHLHPRLLSRLKQPLSGVSSRPCRGLNGVSRSQRSERMLLGIFTSSWIKRSLMRESAHILSVCSPPRNRRLCSGCGHELQPRITAGRSRARESETFNYPASENGGSWTVSVHWSENVDISIHVDTSSFDNSVSTIKHHIDGLTGAVVATEAAQLEEKVRGANAIGQSVTDRVLSIDWI